MSGSVRPLTARRVHRSTELKILHRFTWTVSLAHQDCLLSETTASKHLYSEDTLITHSVVEYLNAICI